MHRAIYATLIMLAGTISAAAPAQQGPYLFDMPRLYPAVHRAWTQALPYAVGPIPDWLSDFKGTVTPIRDVVVGAAHMKFATTCKPHDCGGNIAGVLFSPQPPRAVAVVRLSGKSGGSSLLVVGQMSSAELSCIQRLIDDHQFVVC